MLRILCVLALVAGFSSHAGAVDSDGTHPDDRITPGEIRTTDRAEICGHTTGEFRNVSVTTKIAARRAYGLMSPKAGWCAAEDGCEIDHRVPLTVGGGNAPGSIKNLWPQRPDGPMGFHAKDRCEAAVGRAICDGTLTVQQAQAIFLGDWVVGCAAFMGGLGR